MTYTNPLFQEILKDFEKFSVQADRFLESEKQRQAEEADAMNDQLDCEAEQERVEAL